MLNQEHSNWLETRGLDIEAAVVRFGVRSSGPYLEFPYHDETGKEVYAKRRRLPKRFTAYPTEVPHRWLWNEVCLQEAPADLDVLIITEGETDGLAVAQAGFQYVVSVPDGASKDPREYLASNPEVLSQGGERQLAVKETIAAFDRIIVLTDGDASGIALREKIVAFLGEEFCALPSYPEGCKDAGDVLTTFGIDAVRCLVEKSRSVINDGFVPLDYDEHLPSPTIYSTGFGFLDEHIRFQLPELVVVTGTPGAGKGQFIRAVAANLVLNHGFRVSMFSPEDVARAVRKDLLRAWRHRTKADTTRSEILAKHVAWRNEHFAFIQPLQDQSPTFDWLCHCIQEHCLVHKRQVIIVDPWNEVDHVRDRGVSETDYIGDAIRRLHRIARRFGVLIIIAAHPRKIERGTALTLYDIAGSAKWADKCDCGIILTRLKAAGTLVRINIAKSKRHDEMGKPGKVLARFVERDCNYELALEGEENEEELRNSRGTGNTTGENAAPQVKTMIERGGNSVSTEDDMIAEADMLIN